MLEEHGRYASASPCNAMTVDVEEYFQVAAFEGRIRREAWESYPSRVALNTGRVLDAFAESGTDHADRGVSSSGVDAVAGGL